MDGQQHIAAQVEDQQFPTTTHTLDAPTLDLDQEFGQVGMADGAFPENLGIGDDRANDGGAQLARGVFYFGQFGHTLLYYNSSFISSNY